MIGKTRQPSANDATPNHGAPAGKSRGVLGWPAEAAQLGVLRRLPQPELATCVAHYWRVRWDLRGKEPHLQETLPHPNTYMIFENSELVVSGVSTSKFSRLLEGQSQVFGVKFKPGGLRPFLKTPVSSLTNKIVPASAIFGTDADDLKTRLLRAQDDDEMIAAANDFFQPRVPLPDEAISLAGSLVERILRAPDIRTVDDLVARSGIGKRSLQRLFNEYVGATPKWVIRRYRLHELVEWLNSGEELNWPDIAIELGYFDQSHLINDFRDIVGYSPARYRDKTARDR